MSKTHLKNRKGYQVINYIVKYFTTLLQTEIAVMCILRHKRSLMHDYFYADHTWVFL